MAAILSAMSTKEATHPTVMVGWVASLVVIADGAASTELSSSLVCELCFICVFDMYALFMCCMSVCFTCVYTRPWMSSYMNDDTYHVRGHQTM